MDGLASWVGVAVVRRDSQDQTPFEEDMFKALLKEAGVIALSDLSSGVLIGGREAGFMWPMFRSDSGRTVELDLVVLEVSVRVTVQVAAVILDSGRDSVRFKLSF